MRDLKDLRQFRRNHPDEVMILCTIVRKHGSAYRGIGAKKLIRRNGESCGYLSGGCLEGEIEKAALENWGNPAFIRSFSTMSAEDRLMGYQTGCAGEIDILFEQIPADLGQMDIYFPFGPKNSIAAIGVDLDPENLGRRRCLDHLPPPEEHSFVDPWIETFRLFIIGCGPNARPFAELAPPLGWDVTFLDYRQGNEIMDNPAIRSEIFPLKNLTEKIPEGNRVGIVVMTHNYEADMAVVAQLNNRHFAYIGCVGPRKRFEQIRSDLLNFHAIRLDENWASHVRAPAGLKQGRSPEAIAFSIIAEIQFGIETP